MNLGLSVFYLFSGSARSGHTLAPTVDDFATVGASKFNRGPQPAKGRPQLVEQQSFAAYRIQYSAIIAGIWFGTRGSDPRTVEAMRYANLPSAWLRAVSSSGTDVYLTTTTSGQSYAGTFAGSDGANFFFRDDENRILVGNLKDLKRAAEGERKSASLLCKFCNPRWVCARLRLS
jgi:hypothetical protein